MTKPVTVRLAESELEALRELACKGESLHATAKRVLVSCLAGGQPLVKQGEEEGGLIPNLRAEMIRYISQMSARIDALERTSVKPIPPY